jgi:hypothetical protein
MLLRLIAVVAAAASAAIATITDCSAPTAPFKISRLALRPDPPTPGLPVVLDLEFSNSGPEITPANAGVAATVITLNGLPFSDSKPLCDDTACPIATGFNNRSSETTWPDVTGKVVSTIRWTDAADTELLCIQTTVRVGAPPVLRGQRRPSLALALPFVFQHKHESAPDNSTMCLL